MTDQSDQLDGLTALTARGDAVRRSVLGDAYVDASAEQAFTEPFRQYVTRSAWAQVWARDGLDRRTRSCITLAILAALGWEHELAMHVEVAVRNGLTAQEIQEVLLHTSVYAGAPAGNSAFAVARRTLRELGVIED
jgi:4-carboxymuconolactone decarboxylase